MLNPIILFPFSFFLSSLQGTIPTLRSFLSMEAQRKEYLWAWEDLERAVRERYQETDLALIRRAYDYAKSRA